MKERLWDFFMPSLEFWNTHTHWVLFYVDFSINIMIFMFYKQCEEREDIQWSLSIFTTHKRAV